VDSLGDGCLHLIVLLLEFVALGKMPDQDVDHTRFVVRLPGLESY